MARDHRIAAHTLMDSAMTLVPSECLVIAANMPLTVLGSLCFPSSVESDVLTDILSTAAAASVMSFSVTSGAIVCCCSCNSSCCEL